MTDESLLSSLRAAVESRPRDLTLRLHFAQVLLQSGRAAEAVGQAAVVLQLDPRNTQALSLIQSAQPGPQDRAKDASPRDEDSPKKPAADSGRFDWSAAEAELGDIVPPMFTGARGGSVDGDEVPPPDACDTEQPTLRLADIGGMQHVKERLEVASLAPIRHPELRKTFAKSLRGGLLLYGPPGYDSRTLGSGPRGGLTLLSTVATIPL
jgi:hypothetical protein